MRRLGLGGLGMPFLPTHSGISEEKTRRKKWGCQTAVVSLLFCFSFHSICGRIMKDTPYLFNSLQLLIPTGSERKTPPAPTPVLSADKQFLKSVASFPSPKKNEGSELYSPSKRESSPTPTVPHHLHVSPTPVIQLHNFLSLSLSRL